MQKNATGLKMFLPKCDETLSKLPKHEMEILAKFHWDWIKIANVLLIVHFRPVAFFLHQTLVHHLDFITPSLVELFKSSFRFDL